MEGLQYTPSNIYRGWYKILWCFGECLEKIFIPPPRPHRFGIGGPYRPFLSLSLARSLPLLFLSPPPVLVISIPPKKVYVKSLYHPRYIFDVVHCNGYTLNISMNMMVVYQQHWTSLRSHCTLPDANMNARLSRILMVSSDMCSFGMTPTTRHAIVVHCLFGSGMDLIMSSMMVSLPKVTCSFACSAQLRIDGPINGSCMMHRTNDSDVQYVLLIVATNMRDITCTSSCSCIQRLLYVAACRTPLFLGSGSTDCRYSMFLDKWCGICSFLDTLGNNMHARNGKVYCAHILIPGSPTLQATRWQNFKCRTVRLSTYVCTSTSTTTTPTTPWLPS